MSRKWQHSRRFPSSLPLCLLLLAACGEGAFPGEGGEEIEGVEEGKAGDVQVGGPLPLGTRLQTTANLNLREGPGTSYRVLLTIPEGAEVELVEAEPENGFYRVKYGQVVGWASAAYLRSPAGFDPGPGGAGDVRIVGPTVVPHAQAFANAACAAVGCPYTLSTRPDHSPSADRAIDFMQSPGAVHPPDGGARGDALAAFAFQNWSTYRVLYIIWKQRIHHNDGRGWVPMEDRGSITANHFDHVHVSFHP